MIKLLTFLFVIVILSIAYYFLYKRNKKEKFVEVCNEFNNIQIVFHTTDIIPKIGNVELKNYVSEEFINKILIKPLNNIYLPLKVSFNLLEMKQEDTRKNLRIHYDNFPNKHKQLPLRSRDQDKNYKNLFSQILGTDYISPDFDIQSESETEITQPILASEEDVTEQDIQKLMNTIDDDDIRQIFQQLQNRMRQQQTNPTLDQQSNGNSNDSIPQIPTVTQQDHEFSNMSVRDGINFALAKLPPLIRFLYDYKIMDEFYYPLKVVNKLTLKMLVSWIDGKEDADIDSYLKIIAPNSSEGGRHKLKNALKNHDPSKYIFDPVVIFSKSAKFFSAFKWFADIFRKPWYTIDWYDEYTSLSEGEYSHSDILEKNSKLTEIGSVLIKDGYLLDVYRGKNILDEPTFTLPPGNYSCWPWHFKELFLGFYILFKGSDCPSHFHAFKVREATPEEIQQAIENVNKIQGLVSENYETLLELTIKKNFEGQTTQPVVQETQSVQNTITQEVIEETPEETQEREKKIRSITIPSIISPKVTLKSEIKENGIDNEMLDKFVELDMKIIESEMKNNLTQSKTNILLNLLLNLFDETQYDNKNLHIFLLPYLPNNKKYIILEGYNKKPLILLSLYSVQNNVVNRNIEAFDTSKLGCYFLESFVTNKKKLDKLQQQLDELINGNKEEIKRLNLKRKELQDQLEQIRNKTPDLNEVIQKYNCIQNDLIELYSKDYMKTTEIMKLNRLKKKSNYKGLVKDKIKELQDIDQIQIKKLTKESTQLKKIISENENNVEPIIEELDKIEKLLIRQYSGEENKDKIKLINRQIKQVRSEINKVSVTIKKMGTSIMLGKVFAILNGLRGAETTNNDFDVINSIKNNGIVMDENIKNLLQQNIYKNVFNNFTNDYENHNIVKKMIFITQKCNLINNTSLSNNTNKTNCEYSKYFYYDSIPKLEIYEQISILRDIIENKHNYNYLNDIDINYLSQLLKFLEKEYFGIDEDKEKIDELSNNKLDINYFTDDIFQRKEALKILESIIIEIFEKKGQINVNTKLVEEYKAIYFNQDKYYKNIQERNKLSPTKRVYREVKESINCPSANKPKRNYLKNDNLILDDHMMDAIKQTNKCSLNNYMNSFSNSFI